LWLDPNVYGQFTLTDVPATSDVLFVATGSGVGPFISMLREYHGKQRWKSAAVIHSARLAADLGFHDELTALAARDPDFRYVPTLTREPETSDWKGLRARLQKLFEPDKFRELFGRELTPENMRIFICGNPEMITQLTAQLGERGFRPHRRRNPGHIHTERYW
jgi:ferredoxin--NADP+ reductase